jgi:uncharacterized protein (DUF433 family)
MVTKKGAMIKQNGGMPLGVGLYLHRKAAKITQTSSRRLTYWAQTDLVDPHVHRRDGGPSVYSYNDLLAIRALVRLRAAKLPLQQIRKAIKYVYKHIGSETDWWNLKMVVDKRDLVIVVPKDKSPVGIEETVIATRGGQKPFELMFADLVNDLLAGEELQPFPEIKQYIGIDGRVQGGVPVIKNTRIKTSTIYFWHECGLSSEEISELYGDLDKDAVNAAIRYEDILTKYK